MIRQLCKEVFDIDKDATFIYHTPPPESTVRAYNEQENDTGPDPEDLHLDVYFQSTSRWNNAVHTHLLSKARKAISESYTDLQAVSDAYLLDMIQTKCETLLRTWRATQARPGEDDNGAALRWNEQKQLERKSARQRRRRLTVSPFKTYK